MRPLAGILYVPLGLMERRLLARQARYLVCRCCGWDAPWNPAGDVCEECEVHLVGGLIEQRVAAANARIRVRVMAVARERGI